MEFRRKRSMPRWKATLISGLVIVASFYASADLESRNRRLFQAKKTLETTSKIYGTVDESASETVQLVITNRGGNNSRR
jgi:hypothetical protein